MQIKGCCPLDCQDSCSWVAHVEQAPRQPRCPRRRREGSSDHARRTVRQGARLRGARDGARAAAAAPAPHGRQGLRRVRADLVGRGARHHRRPVQGHHCGARRGSPAAVPVSGVDGRRSALRLAPHLSCAGGQPARRERVRRVGVRAARGRASDECRPRGNAGGAPHPAVGPERADDLSSPVALHRAGTGERRARHCHRSAPDPHDQDVRCPSWRRCQAPTPSWPRPSAGICWRPVEPISDWPICGWQTSTRIAGWWRHGRSRLRPRQPACPSRRLPSLRRSSRRRGRH